MHDTNKDSETHNMNVTQVLKLKSEMTFASIFLIHLHLSSWFWQLSMDRMKDASLGREKISDLICAWRDAWSHSKPEDSIIETGCKDTDW